MYRCSCNVSLYSLSISFIVGLISFILQGSRVGHDPPWKVKKLTIIDLLCEILYNFMSVLGFGWSNFPENGVVAHPKNLNNSIICLFFESLNIFSMVIVFHNFKSGVLIFVMLTLGILSCQPKILSINNRNV